MNLIKLISFSGLLFTCYYCQKVGETTAKEIVFSPLSTPRVKPSDILTFKGFTHLSNEVQNPLRSITKVLFRGNSMIVLDARTDFHDIYHYEVSSGKRLNKIGFQSEQPGGYDQVYDIDFSNDEDKIVLFSNQNTSFMTYNFQGELLGQLRNGVLGGHFATLPNGGYVVYNEFGSTDISGCNFLVFFDKYGNVLKRMMPYPESMDQYGYSMSGFLGNTGKEIVFSPPFCDTVYTIVNQKVTPLFNLNFLDKAPPLVLKSTKLDELKITSPMVYLDEGMVRSKNLLVFHFYDSRDYCLGLYDESKNVFWDASMLSHTDCLYPLLQKGSIFPKDSDEIALVLEPRIIRQMLSNEVLDMEALSLNYPDLAKAIEDNKQTPGYFILYFEAK